VFDYFFDALFVVDIWMTTRTPVLTHRNVMVCVCARARSCVCVHVCAWVCACVRVSCVVCGVWWCGGVVVCGVWCVCEVGARGLVRRALVRACMRLCVRACVRVPACPRDVRVAAKRERVHVRSAVFVQDTHPRLDDSAHRV